jgi:integrase
MSVSQLLNAAGRRRSPVTLPGYLAGRPPRNKGLRYPPDPPAVEEIVAVMRQAGDSVHGARLRALIVLLWRAGVRINEALTVTEHDLEPRAGSVLVRHGKGGRRREVGMDRWGWGPPPSLARIPPGDACRPAAVRDRRADPEAPLGE